MPSYFWMRLVERVDALEVEVVRRFVEDEDVGLLQHDLAEEQAGGFASGESVGLLEAFFAAEEHLAEDAADVFLGGLGVEAVEPLGGGRALGDGCRCGPARSSRSETSWPHLTVPESMETSVSSRPGPLASRALRRVVLPCPLRPMRTTLSPRWTEAEKLLMTCSVLPSVWV